jgi:hypothetical protein
MPAFVTEYPQFFTASIKGWQKLPEYDKYKDIIIMKRWWLYWCYKKYKMYNINCLILKCYKFLYFAANNINLRLAIILPTPPADLNTLKKYFQKFVQF